MKSVWWVAFVSLLVLSAPSLASAMSFRAVTAGPCATRQCLLATGTITALSTEFLRSFIREHRIVEGAIVFVASPGGDHVSGIALGREIRKRGLNTFVAGYDADRKAFVDADCASACVYMFVGGVQRGAGSGSRLGVHQVVLNSPTSMAQGMSGAQWFMGLAAEHILQMGADPRLMALALKTPSDGMRWLSRRDMRGSKAITLDNGLDRPPENLGALSFFDVVG